MHDLLRVKRSKSTAPDRQLKAVFEPGQIAVLIEDVITTGGSITQRQKCLEGGLDLRDVVVLVDREQGGEKAMKESGFPFIPF
jgi:orotate phosphoribosyltransferase